MVAATRLGLSLLFCALTAAAGWTSWRFGRVWLLGEETLAIAVSTDGPDRVFASKLQSALAAEHFYLRLELLPSDDPLALFSRHDADLVVAPPFARAVVRLEKEIVLLGREKAKNSTALKILKIRLLCRPIRRPPIRRCCAQFSPLTTSPKTIANWSST